MKFPTLILTLFLLGFASCAPTEEENDDIIINKDFFPESLVVHSSEHDIVSIVVPLNHLNLDDDDDDNEDSFDDEANSNSSKSILFFVLADIHDDGKKDYKGVYFMNKTLTKLILENGTEVTTQFGKNKNAYFAAKDGIYSFNADKLEAEKYGSVTDNLISIAVENGSDTLFVLNVNRELYKVTEKGNKKIKLNDDVEDFALDFSNNLYYYGKDKQPYALTNNGIKKIEGLPASKYFIKLLRPAFVIDDGVPIIVDNKAYVIYSNGSAEVKNVKLEVRPSAFAIDAAIIQYYGYNKKIYEYNLIEMITLDPIEGLQEHFKDIKDDIQRVATRKLISN